MMEMTLVKRVEDFVPATEKDREVAEGIKTGEGITASWRKRRNLGFHRKFFALLQVGFDAWCEMEVEMPKFRGQQAEKNFERFRKDVLCLAGFYNVVYTLKGEMRVEPKSISFGTMDQQMFENVYSAVANVLLKRVLVSYTKDDLDQVVNQIITMC